MVQSVIVSVIEPERLEAWFQVPINFRQKQKLGRRSFDGGDCSRPELLRGSRSGIGKRLPVPGEDFVEYQHGHVAANAVAKGGDALQLLDHRVAGGRVAIIELGRVAPGWKIRVFAVRQPARVDGTLTQKGRRLPGWTLNEKLRPLLEPRMIQPGVVG